MIGMAESRNMGKHIKVSVIVPVYNAETYLDDCIGSILAQSLPDFELICVDNGSTDNSLALLEKYRTANSEHMAVYTCDGTAGDARNCGLDHAGGDYVLFLDADDFFDEHLLEVSYNAAIEHNADVTLFGGSRYDHQNDTLIETSVYLNTQLLPEKECFSPNDAATTLLQLTLPNPWTKLFKKSYIESLGIRFQSLPNSNDFFFCYGSLACANRIVAIDADLVRYRFNTGRSMQDTKGREPLCFLEAIYALNALFESRGLMPTLRKTLQAALIETAKYNLLSAKTHTIRYLILEAFDTPEFDALELLGKPESNYRSAYTYQNAKLLEQALILHRLEKKGNGDLMGFGDASHLEEEANNSLICVYKSLLDYKKIVAETESLSDELTTDKIDKAVSSAELTLSTARKAYPRLSKSETMALSLIAPSDFILLKTQIEDYCATKAKYEKEIEQLRISKRKLTDSKSYRLGNALLRPFRAAKRLLHTS